MRYQAPVAPLPLTVGQQLHFAGDPHPWTVKAVSEHFAAATRIMKTVEAPMAYTVIDWRNGIREEGWGDGSYTEARCAAMLAEFESGGREVSSRNWVPIEFGEVA